MISAVEIGKIAGLLEGEGYFGLPSRGQSRVRSRGRKLGILIAVSMTDRDDVEWIAARWQARVCSYLPQRRPREKRVYVAKISGLKAAQWLMTIYSLMGARRKARIVQQLAVWRTPNRQRECIHGHAFDKTNTWLDQRGHQHCRTCHRKSQNARYHRNREKEKSHAA